jgi:hypothetical protein
MAGAVRREPFQPARCPSTYRIESFYPRMASRVGFLRREFSRTGRKPKMPLEICPGTTEYSIGLGRGCCPTRTVSAHLTLPTGGGPTFTANHMADLPRHRRPPGGVPTP